jgi:TIR domain-containing protein
MESVGTYSYDVFISYSHQDQTWVKQDLLSELEAKGLQVCIDYRDFEPGAASVSEMRRAVTSSRKTLLVLTPDYVQSAWTEFEVLMVQTLDPANQQRRLIPLRKERCDVPEEIRYLNYVDFVNPVDWKIEWSKLLTALGKSSIKKHAANIEPASEARRVDDASRSAREGLEALIELMDNNQVQSDVGRFEAIFETTCKQIDSLACYKDLHDLLHTLQFRCYNYLNAVLQNAKKSPDDLSVWENVFEYETTLEDIMVGLRKYADNDLLYELVPWTRRMVADLKRLFEAVTCCNPEQIAVCLRPISQVLFIQPVLINTRMNEAARALPLPSLVNALSGVSQTLDLAPVNPNTVRKFKSGVAALSNLHTELTSLIKEHDKWQEVDIELRRIEATLGQDLADLELSWSDLKKNTDPGDEALKQEWAQLLLEDMTKLDQAISSKNPNKSKQYFIRYRNRIGNRFYRVDAMLKDLCSNLRRVGEPLAGLLEIM